MTEWGKSRDECVTSSLVTGTEEEDVVDGVEVVRRGNPACSEGARWVLHLTQLVASELSVSAIGSDACSDSGYGVILHLEV